LLKWRLGGGDHATFDSSERDLTQNGGRIHSIALKAARIETKEWGARATARRAVAKFHGLLSTGRNRKKGDGEGGDRKTP
jgi:hypothetical protein